MLKKILLSATAFAALGGVSLAADLPVRKEAPAYIAPAPIFTWTGAYFGVNAGGVFTRNKVSFAGTDLLDGGKINKTGFIGGVQAGYNWQMGMWLVGVEGDMNITSAKKSLGDVDPATFSAIAVRSDLRWLGTARLRVGAAFERLLVYGTGGLAFGDGRNSVDMFLVDGVDSLLVASARKTAVRAGWTIGAGAEYAITNNLTVKGEYLYYSLGKKSMNLIPTEFGVGAADAISAKFKNDGHIVRAGVNWKF